MISRDRATAPARFAAWGVHLVTAAGVPVALAALGEIHAGRFDRAFAWMTLGVLLDGIDGPLARRFAVARVLPSVNGAHLDDLADFLHYVVVPAFLMLRAGLLPPGAAWLGVSALCVASALRFVRADAKDALDHTFGGFPSYWNVVVFYLVILRPPPAFSLALVLVLAALVLAPLRCPHPVRTPTLRRTTLALTALWLASLVALWSGLPHPPGAWVAVSLGYPAYYTALSVALTLRRMRNA